MTRGVGQINRDSPYLTSARTVRPWRLPAGKGQSLFICEANGAERSNGDCPFPVGRRNRGAGPTELNWGLSPFNRGERWA